MKNHIHPLNIMKIYTVIIFSLLISSLVVFAGDNVHNYIPPEGYVPNKETAIKIAIAIWEPIYGEETIKKQAPYNVALKDGIWHVQGSLETLETDVDENGKKIFFINAGGVAEIEISKFSGQILRVSHGE